MNLGVARPAHRASILQSIVPPVPVDVMHDRIVRRRTNDAAPIPLEHHANCLVVVRHTSARGSLAVRIREPFLTCTRAELGTLPSLAPRRIDHLAASKAGRLHAAPVRMIRPHLPLALARLGAESIRFALGLGGSPPKLALAYLALERHRHSKSHPPASLRRRPCTLSPRRKPDDSR
jgi:hypothetical protein